MANLQVEWDEAKNRSNVAKHGVGFARARAVFNDVFAIEWQDDRLLTVVYTPRDNVIRLISARAATTIERRRYHEENS